MIPPIGNKIDKAKILYKQGLHSYQESTSYHDQAFNSHLGPSFGKDANRFCLGRLTVSNRERIVNG